MVAGDESNQFPFPTCGPNGTHQRHQACPEKPNELQHTSTHDQNQNSLGIIGPQKHTKAAFHSLKRKWFLSQELYPFVCQELFGPNHPKATRVTSSSHLFSEKAQSSLSLSKGGQLSSCCSSVKWWQWRWWRWWPLSNSSELPSQSPRTIPSRFWIPRREYLHWRPHPKLDLPFSTEMTEKRRIQLSPEGWTSTKPWKKLKHWENRQVQGQDWRSHQLK